MPAVLATELGVNAGSPDRLPINNGCIYVSTQDVAQVSDSLSEKVLREKIDQM
jgi:hypothetical protein